MNKDYFAFIILSAAVIAMGGFLFFKNGFSITNNILEGAISNDAFQCLETKNVKLYGADWCENCKTQEELLGAAALSRIEHILCSTAQEGIISPECRNEHIRALPTWEFPDKNRREGIFTLKEIQMLAGCEG